MKKLSQMGRLDMDTIFAIMTEEKANQRETVKIGMDKLRKYFPRGTTPKQIEDTEKTIPVYRADNTYSITEYTN